MLKLILTCFTLFSGVAIAGEIYTMSELKKMIAKKQYPKIINPRETIGNIEFKYCKAMATDFVNSAEEEGYPAEVISRKKELFVTKIWRGNGMTQTICKKGENIKDVMYDYAD